MAFLLTYNIVHESPAGEQTSNSVERVVGDPVSGVTTVAPGRRHHCLQVDVRACGVQHRLRPSSFLWQPA